MVISSDGVVDGALSERNARIRQEGRTWSYVLHRAATPEESDVVITQNERAANTAGQGGALCRHTAVNG